VEEATRAKANPLRYGRDVSYWLKVGGTRENPIRDDWQNQSNEWRRQYGAATMFPRRPRILPGDLLVMYAAGSPGRYGAGRIYALHKVTGAAEQSNRHDRWTWEVPTEPIVLGPPSLEACPKLGDIDVSTRSVRHQSHIRLTDDQGRLAEELITAAAERG
jgi:hypothetical protein